jgi:hypothetical protein
LPNIKSVSTDGEPLPRYPDSVGANHTAREVNDIFDILNKLDERQLLKRLPRYVTGSSDNIPSMKLEDGDLRSMLTKMDKMEAIIHDLRATVHTLHSLMAAIEAGLTATPVPSNREHSCCILNEHE